MDEDYYQKFILLSLKNWCTISLGGTSRIRLQLIQRSPPTSACEPTLLSATNLSTLCLAERLSYELLHIRIDTPMSPRPESTIGGAIENAAAENLGRVEKHPSIKQSIIFVKNWIPSSWLKKLHLNNNHTLII